MDEKHHSPSSRPVFSNPWKRAVPKASPGAPDGKIAHTLTACTRCRQRKSRCDPGIPRCESCAKSNARCVYYDPARNETIPRTYIVQLRERARMLEKRIEEAESEIQHAADAELMVRDAGRIRFNANEEARYLGPASGIAITRLVMEIAKQNTDSKSIKAVVPEITAHEIRDMFAKESSKPTSKVYPMISSVPTEELPQRPLTNKLIDLYMVKGQSMWPVLHEPTFRQDVDDVFNGSDDSVKNFQLRMVIAISMQKLSAQYAGLADSYYLAALPFLQQSLRRMSLGSLQCLILIGQYSLVTPTRTASYWVVGCAVKLAQDLGLFEEATITKSPTGEPLNSLEVDMRRRVAWVIISNEFGLAHSLGRPSAICISHDHLDLKFFELVDDRYITPQGILPESKPVLSKCIAIHFFKMRLLQAEIRRTLYLKKRDTPVDDQDPWFTQMLEKVDRWVAECPKNDGGSGLSELWFQGRRNTIIVFLFRPSPQIPEPSVYAARMCYDASVFNVGMQRKQIATGSVDLTWAFTQSLFMAINTILWSLSYPEIRRDHPIEEVSGYLQVALEGMALASERWPGVQSALHLYRNLITACLKAYGTGESFVVHSPSSHPSPASAQDVATPPTMSSPSSTTTASYLSFRNPKSAGDSDSLRTISRGPSAEPVHSSPAQAAAVPQTMAAASSGISKPYMPPDPPIQSFEQNIYDSQSYVPTSTIFPDAQIDPTTPFNNFPSVLPGLPGWDPNFMTASTTAGQLSYMDASVDPMLWMGTIGEAYSQYSHQPFPTTPWRERTLSQQEQLELMETLEDNIPDVSAQLLNQVGAYYRS